MKSVLFNWNFSHTLTVDSRIMLTLAAWRGRQRNAGPYRCACGCRCESPCHCGAHCFDKSARVPHLPKFDGSPVAEGKIHGREK